MEASRLHVLFKNVPPFSLQKFIRFSSSPGARRFVSDESSAEGSSIYRHTLKFQRPATIKLCDRFHNSVSLIGSVDRPVERGCSVHGDPYAYTSLHVKPFRGAKRDFRILLMMWDNMAEISIKHLKPDDLIYVSGHLQMFTNGYDDGQLGPRYKLMVNELNFVANCGKPPTYKEIEKSESGGENGRGKYRNRLYLWQVFFSNPDDWWDNRKSKKKPTQPDFKHKYTDEVLWRCKGDPVWVRKQLQRHDSRKAELGLVKSTAMGSLSPMRF